MPTCSVCEAAGIVKGEAAMPACARAERVPPSPLPPSPPLDELLDELPEPLEELLDELPDELPLDELPEELPEPLDEVVLVSLPASDGVPPPPPLLLLHPPAAAAAAPSTETKSVIEPRRLRRPMDPSWRWR
jgi:hypothetical protein